MRTLSTVELVVLTGVMSAASGEGAMGQSVPSWRVLPGLGGECSAVMVSSGQELGGTGVPALYVGGNFSIVPSAEVFPGAVARLSGGGVGGPAAWVGLGPTMVGPVLSLTEADLGAGARVFAGGFFSLATGGLQQPDCVGWWDGSAWRALGAPGYTLTWCGLVAGFDVDGTGQRLLVSGSPSGSADYAKAWRPGAGGVGGSWSQIGGEVFTLIHDVLEHDDGSGAGERLFGANGTLEGVFWFDGAVRGAPGGSTGGWPQALVSRGDGADKRLYAAGQFSRAGGFGASGADASSVASWDGARWRGLGGSGRGVFRTAGGPGTVHALAVWDDGRGEKVWVGGEFGSVGGPEVGARIAANNLGWFAPSAGDVDSGVWGSAPAGGITELDPFGSAFNGVQQLVVFDFDGPGGRPPALVVAGQFSRAGGVAVGNIAVLDAAWCGVADVGRQGGIAKPDGVLDSNDFVAFVDLFFGSDARADVGGQGGASGGDGVFDNNDFVVLIDAFFAGC